MNFNSNSLQNYVHQNYAKQNYINQGQVPVLVLNSNEIKKMYEKRQKRFSNTLKNSHERGLTSYSKRNQRKSKKKKKKQRHRQSSFKRRNILKKRAKPLSPGERKKLNKKVNFAKGTRRNFHNPEGPELLSKEEQKKLRELQDNPDEYFKLGSRKDY